MMSDKDFLLKKVSRSKYHASIYLLLIRKYDEPTFHITTKSFIEKHHIELNQAYGIFRTWQYWGFASKDKKKHQLVPCRIKDEFVFDEVIKAAEEWPQ